MMNRTRNTYRKRAIMAGWQREYLLTRTPAFLRRLDYRRRLERFLSPGCIPCSMPGRVEAFVSAAMRSIVL